MLLSRERRHRLPVTATALLGLLFALLTCSASVASAAAALPAAAPAGVSAGVSAGSVAVVAPTADVVHAPGCGKGVRYEDSGTRPATPPRGGSSYELLPALHDAHGASGSWCQDGTTLDIPPERGPPPLAPPSPVDLSILRV